MLIYLAAIEKRNLKKLEVEDKSTTPRQILTHCVLIYSLATKNHNLKKLEIEDKYTTLRQISIYFVLTCTLAIENHNLKKLEIEDKYTTLRQISINSMLIFNVSSGIADGCNTRRPSRLLVLSSVHALFSYLPTRTSRSS